MRLGGGAAEVSEVDQSRCGRAGEDAGEDGEQGFAFGVSMGAEAGGEGSEIGVVVAGVADELPEPGREMAEDLIEGVLVEAASGGDAEGAIGGERVPVAGCGGVALGARLEGIEQAELEASEGTAMAEAAVPGRFEGIADGGDRGLLGCLKEGDADRGKEVGVLVGVEVGDGDSGELQLADLGERLATDVGGEDAAAEGSVREGHEGGSEAAAVGADEAGDAGGGRDGDAIDENDVAADAEAGVAMGDGDGVREGRAVGHQGCGGEDACVMELGDGAVDACGEAEVIGVDDEPGGDERLRGGWVIAGGRVGGDAGVSLQQTCLQLTSLQLTSL